MNSLPEKSLLADDPYRFKALYFEIVYFLESCGGVYRRIDRLICARVLYCLDMDLYYLKRNEDGAIVEFCGFWLICPDDLEAVRQRKQPSTTNKGTFLYIVDHGNKGGNVRDMIKWLRQRCKGGSGVAWRHKGQDFKCFLSQKGDTQ
jgi:hypothetical protein